MASNPRPLVQVASRFQRSVQLESDLAREDALDGYVLHGRVLPRNHGRL